MKKKILSLLFLSFTIATMAQKPLFCNDFSNNEEQLTTRDRGVCQIHDGVLYAKDSYACFGDKQMTNYSVSFRARTPKGEEQVQIWAGFRAANRFDRYVVGIKGGLQDDVYLLRMGYMGTDEFMGVRPLKFHPVPGEWYDVRVEAVGNRIRVFVGDEVLPYIDLVDKNNQATAAGQVTLGGGWIPTEYDDLKVMPMADDALKDVKNTQITIRLNDKQKAEKRVAERAAYKPITVNSLNNGRTDISLDGNWLFMPTYSLDDNDKAVSVNTDDEDWHVMNVPDFWNPIRIWLHGETMGTPRGPEHKGVSDTYYQKETDRCQNYSFDYEKTRAAYYRQWVVLPDNIEGKNINLHFDAVSKAADIYINGVKAGDNIGMFKPIDVDGTSLFHPGKNLIVVKVTRNPDNNDNNLNNQLDAFYSNARDLEARGTNSTNGSGTTEKQEKKDITLQEILKGMAHGFYGNDPAGIWQPVSLTITDPVKIEDVYIKPSLTGATFDMTVRNNTQKNTKITILTDIVDHKTGEVLYSGENLANVKIAAGNEQVITYSVDNLRPKYWSPDFPNLYDFKFRLSTGDDMTITSGFRTFEVKDGHFLLNGKRYWLRGGNQCPSAICPNDYELAHRFMQLMTEGNIKITRTHTSPWNELWMTAADEEGIGVSMEGTWSWLMLGDTEIPHPILLKLWRDEFLAMVKKYRNHPSLLFWTINNEMKFYHNDPDDARAKEKFQIISDVVKQIRVIDPIHPISFDSNYHRKFAESRFGKEFFADKDDGDIDDVHGYFNWYDYSLFKFFDGTFEKWNITPGRPLISQEMSTGYPNNETGHPTRSYQIIHQTAMSLIGYKGYDYCNPEYFLKTQAFTTGEVAEALRRADPNSSGVLHFSLHTWFKQVYNAKNITPWPTYYALKRALQPVLVSAELWGRNLYSGQKLTNRVFICNDREDGSAIKPSNLSWRIVTDNGRILARGDEDLREIAHYEHFICEPEIVMPDIESLQKVKLMFTLTEGGKVVSQNEYVLTLAPKEEVQNNVTGTIAWLGDDAQARFLNANIKDASCVADLFAIKADKYVISEIKNVTEAEAQVIRKQIASGKKIVFLQCNEVARSVFPEYIKDWINPTEGDVTHMENEDDKVFDGIGVLDLKYFNNNLREMPRACSTTLKTVRNDNVEELGGQMKIHAYIDGGTPQDRINRIDKIRGFTLLRIHDAKGSAIVSTMRTDKAPTDPIAAKLLTNIIND